MANDLELYRRARQMQQAILSRGGPPPHLRAKFYAAVGQLDAWQRAQREGLGFFWLIPMALVFGAVLLIFQATAEGSNVVAGTGQAATKAGVKVATAAGEAGATTVGLLPWVVGAASLIWLGKLARGRKSGRRRATRRRAKKPAQLRKVA